MTEDNLENRWVNYIIRMILKSLKQLQIMFEHSRSEQRSKLNKKREQVQGFQARLNRIKDSYGYEKGRRELNGLIAISEREILRLSEGLVKINESLRELNKMITHLTRYTKTNELGKASSRLTQKKPTLRLLKDARYASLYRFYKNIETAQRNKHLLKQITFPYKKTALLFEYYVLCLIIDSLKANGFIWTKGWLADEEDPTRLIDGLASETLLRFESPDGRFYIELAYDMSIINTNDDSLSHFKANINRTPDFRIAMYTSKGLFLNA
ncbi:hypothetical protein DX130_03245 [Paenibacillus paeoniae]|uniref:DUF2357 domain-containing protein n=1 Tax=Paenibacillus paeoniae TaxID=2292705 RepID=A0A371PIP4_9BACL|nr:hypothetical protein DX130_03245 [Paenibacillus paeoniae]